MLKSAIATERWDFLFAFYLVLPCTFPCIKGVSLWNKQDPLSQNPILTI